MVGKASSIIVQVHAPKNGSGGVAHFHFGVQHFVEKSNQEFSVVVAERKSELENMRLKERISVLVRWRLELTAPFIGPNCCSYIVPQPNV